MKKTPCGLRIITIGNTVATKLERTSLSVQVYIHTKCVLRFGNGVR